RFVRNLEAAAPHHALKIGVKHQSKGPQSYAYCEAPGELSGRGRTDAELKRDIAILAISCLARVGPKVDAMTARKNFAFC
ncbi:hypothetical protein, partial [Bradyrhizobium sp. S3.2.12]|uniref:hypothetical protein n=1 Tax=Bradyrhizobium sp. S3.2.12 TaxID=3156387 RepID=UPI003392410D